MPSLKVRGVSAAADGKEVVVADMTVSFKLVRETFSRVTCSMAEPQNFVDICARRSATGKSLDL